MAKHAVQVDRKRLLLIAVAVVALVGIIVTTALLATNSKSKKPSATEMIDSIHSFQNLDVPASAKPVTAAQKCLDDDGDLMAYAVTAYGEGFADKVSVRCFFDLDKNTLIGIEIAKHNEKKGTGDKIATSLFTQHFEFKKMPMWFNDGSVPEEELPKGIGTRVDTISGATISCRAVVEAVNTAYTYCYQEM